VKLKKLRTLIDKEGNERFNRSELRVETKSVEKDNDDKKTFYIAKRRHCGPWFLPLLLFGRNQQACKAQEQPSKGGSSWRAAPGSTPHVVPMILMMLTNNSFLPVKIVHIHFLVKQ
jgi:hypothetical protein